MLMPAIFHDDFDLFDRFVDDDWFDDREFKNLEKKLYGHRAKNVMNTDIKETDHGYEMLIDLPGFAKEDVKVELNDGYLIVSAEKGFDKNESDSKEDKKNGKYIRKERYSGSCKRSFYVGDAVTQEDIKASFKHGILTLDIPKKDKKALDTSKYIAIAG
jgi:HSP20 family molecular chaperone IbpA